MEQKPGGEGDGEREQWRRGVTTANSGHDGTPAAELRAVLESMTDAVYIGDASGITLANQAALDQLGFATRDELNRSIATLAAEIHTRDAATGEFIPAEQQAFSRALAGERVVQDVIVRHRTLGEDRVVRCAAAPVIVDGRVIAAVAVNTDVTERAFADARLREAEQRYLALFNAIDQGFCTIEVKFDDRDRPVDYRFVEVSPSFERQTGIRDGAGRWMRDIAADQDEHWFERYGRVARTGVSERFEEGSTPLGRWWSVYAFRIGDPAQRRIGVLFHDVSERKRAEAERERLVAELQLERARLAAVFAQAPSVLAIVRGPNHVLEMANDAYLAVNGHRDLIGKPLLDAVPELRGQGFDKLLDAVVDTGVPFVGREVPIWLSTTRGAPPEERFFDFVYLPLVEADATGTPVRVGVIAHGNDITEQVSARRDAEAARERADRLQALTAALAATRTVDEVAEIVVAQGAAAMGAATGMLALRVAGVAAVEAVMLGRHGLTDAMFAEYGRVPISAPTPTAACMRRGEPFFIETREELLACFPEMRAVWEQLGTHALVTVPLVVVGETVGAISFTFADPRTLPDDIRRFFLAFGGQAAQSLERARLFEAERAARAEAEAANRAKSEFLAVMSHELRTPLNAIGGYAELIELGIHGPVTDAQRNALERIQRSQRHLLGLIAGVLDYSRVEAGAVTYRLSDVPVTEAVAEAELLIAPQLRAKGLGYAWSGAAPDLAVRADREKLQQILLNLLGNAVKFTDRRDGEPGRIEVTCTVEQGARGEAAAGQVAIHVRDTGEGIAPAELERIFEPFVQADQRLTRPHSGVGLGLAISRDLARGMGGDLTAQSTLGAGSTFTLTLRRS